MGQGHLYPMVSSPATKGGLPCIPTPMSSSKKGPRQAAIVAHLSAHKHRAFTSPTAKGFTFVYAPFDTWTAIAEELSRTFQCPAFFAFGYDGEVFGYTLSEHSHVRDGYVSAPDYDATGCGPAQRAGPRGGEAAVLCAVFGRGQTVAQVEAILHPPGEGPLREAKIDAYDQHWALAQALDNSARAEASDGGPLLETP